MEVVTLQAMFRCKTTSKYLNSSLNFYSIIGYKLSYGVCP